MGRRACASQTNKTGVGNPEVGLRGAQGWEMPQGKDLEWRPVRGWGWMGGREGMPIGGGPESDMGIRGGQGKEPEQYDLW